MWGRTRGQGVLVDSGVFAPCSCAHHLHTCGMRPCDTPSTRGRVMTQVVLWESDDAGGAVICMCTTRRTSHFMSGVDHPGGTCDACTYASADEDAHLGDASKGRRRS